MTTDETPTEPDRGSLAMLGVWPNMKLVRAQVHFNELLARINSWQSSGPFSQKAVIADDRMSWRLTLELRQPPPADEWALIAGDCIHNLRSALDAAVWGLATLNGATPPNPQSLYFPLIEDRTKWDPNGLAKVAGVPQEHIDRIESLQPYNHTTEQGKVSALTLLHKLDIADKHHAGVTASVIPQQLIHNGGIEYHTEEAMLRNMPPATQLGEPAMQDGAVLLEQTTLDPIKSVRGGFTLNLLTGLTTPYGVMGLTNTLTLMNKAVVNTLTVIHGGADLLPVSVEVPDDDPPTERPPRDAPR